MKLLLSSKARESGSSGDFYLRLSKPVEGAWRLAYLFICADFPTVQTGYNDTVYFSENLTSKTAAIPQGTYTSATLATALGAALTAASGTNTYTATFNATTGTMTITSTGNFQLTFSNTTNSIASMLGFANVDTALGLTVTGTSTLTLCPSVAFHIDIDGSGSYINEQGRPCTFYTPIHANVGLDSWIEQVPGIEFPQRMRFSQPKSRLHVRVLDDDGRVIPLQQDWQLMLEEVKC